MMAPAPPPSTVPTPGKTEPTPAPTSAPVVAPAVAPTPTPTTPPATPRWTWRLCPTPVRASVTKCSQLLVIRSYLSPFFPRALAMAASRTFVI